jgi:hypothetical protein
LNLGMVPVSFILVVPLGVEPRVATGAVVGDPVAKPLGVEPREGTGAAVGLPVTETLGVEPREAVGAVVVCQWLRCWELLA